MTDPETTRTAVRDAYSKAVSREPEAGGCCCKSTETKGVAVQSAGYDPATLASLPEDAVVNSFGCGNPVALDAVQEGDIVLDLGSGAGIDLLLAAERVGPTGRVIGVDMTDAMVGRATANIRESGATNIEVRKGLIEDLPVDDASVDLVISNCVINLSPEKDRVFGEIARVLRPGGRISIADIVVDHLPDEVRSNEHLRDVCVAGAISEDAYIAGLERAGLTDVHTVDRIEYSASQIKAIIESELGDDVRPESAGGGCCATDIGAIAESVNARSVRFVATKS